MLMSSQRKPNTKPLLIALAIFAGGIAYYLSQNETKNDSTDLNTKSIRLVGKAKAPLSIKNNKDSPYNQDGELALENMTESEKKTIKFKANPVLKTELEKKKEKQKIIRQEFKNLIKADFEMPENLDYVNMDLDEGIAGVFGTGRGDILGFTALAKEGSISTKMAVGYLNDSSSGLPFSGKVQFSEKAIMKINNPPGTNIREVLVYESSNPSFKAALLKRSDNKGTYLMILEADPLLYSNNEGYLDKLLLNFKAKGP